ncbi:heterokaryon incompatibility protein-domain-containing protein, partial [Usnea florida]
MEWGKTLLSYTPLVTGAREFRLFLLASGDENESIDGAILHASLDDHPPYEALSYTWDNRVSLHPINVDGCTFMVTRNLLAALRRLRLPDQDRYLWVDAICINQSDILERNHQVKQMHWMYQLAERVVVWLGEHSEDSRLAIDQLEMISNLDPKDCASQLREMAGFDRHLPMGPRFGKPIDRFFLRPWWSRVWVMPEVVWASKIIVMCGDQELSWDMLLRAHLVMKSGDRSQRTHYAGEFFSVSIWDLFLHHVFMVNESPISLEYTLDLVRIRNATDPRDKVFAILNIIPLNEWPGEPDYSKNVVDVFTDVVKHVIHKTKKLEILRSCERIPIKTIVGRQDHFRKEYQVSWIEDLPSWAPDRSITRFTVNLLNEHDFEDGLNPGEVEYYHTSGNSNAQYGLLAENKILTVEGICYDAIQYATKSMLPSITNMNQPAFFNQLEFVVNHIFKAPQGYKNDITREEAFWRTLIADRTSKGLKASPEYAREFCEWRKSGRQTPMAWAGYMTSAQRACYGRSLFFTSKGLLGLGPEEARPTDVVAVLLGCSVPMLLRKVESRYQVLGEAYVHGIMEGEAMEELRGGTVALTK